MVICLGQGEVQTCIWPTSLPLTVSCYKNQIGFGFTFLVQAHLGSPGQNPESHKTAAAAAPATAAVAAAAAAVVVQYCSDRWY